MAEEQDSEPRPRCTCLDVFAHMRADGGHYWHCPLADPVGDLRAARDRAREEYRKHGSRYS